jgi:hypothetical protein
MFPFQYPSPTLEDGRDVQIIRIARHCPCNALGCDCQGLHPAEGQNVEIVLEEDAEFSEEMSACACRHSWNKHGSLNRLVDGEIERRARVAVRADEFLEVRGPYYPLF